MSISLLDRMRIEGVVWALDQRLYDLPRRSRIEKRREVRDNLRAAANDVGTRAAIAGLGNGRDLADEYLSAEFGYGRRPSWIAAAIFLLTGVLVATSLFSDAVLAYRDGILAGNPHATGSYTWGGIDFLQTSVHYKFTNGSAEFTGGAFSPWCWLLWLVGAILIGRLWTVPGVWRRPRAVSRAV